LTRTRVATSASLTIGAAFATLLVAGGILAGPTIMACSSQGGSIGACLRDRLDQSGLVAPKPPAAPPVAPAEPPARDAGWIEANATEYEAPLPGVADLRGPPGALGAGGSATSHPSISAAIAIAPGPQTIAGGGVASGGAGSATEVALAETPGQLGAGGGITDAGTPATVALAPAPGQLGAGGGVTDVTSSANVALAPAPGQIGATGSVARPATAPDIVAFAAPTGSLSASGAEGASVTAGAPADASSVPLPDIGGAVGSSAIAAGVTLQAALEPPPAAPKLVAVDPPILLTTPLPELDTPVAVVPPPEDAPRKIPKYNPRYPNVIVLPPPATGSNSSFAVLEVR
jgi:pilus assembly protein FimV